MIVKSSKSLRAIATVGATAAVAACASEASDEGVVARVGPYRLMVDQTVELLVDQENLAAEARVVESLAELWIDYTLLAEAAHRDSLFSDLDLEPLVMQQVAQAMVFQLRDSVIQVDTFITEDELRVRYEAEAPAVEVRARHIMLQPPLQASQAQQDSVREVLEGLRERILRGESFEALAGQFSQDPGSARNGGDLGYFGRGDMVAPFEEAALALQPGEVSDVVATPMGFHLIRLDERAESIFVAGLTDQASPQVTEGSLDILRETAANPGARLAGRAERRALIEWEGGSVTVGRARELLQLEPAQLRSQIAEGSPEELEAFLENLARRELLMASAEAEGLRPVRDSVDLLVEDARGQLREATRMLGLLELDRAPGEELEVAVSRAVEEALADILSGATQVVPLGIVSFRLREGRSSTILGTGVGQVIVDVAEIRTARQLSPVEGIAVDSAVAGREEDPGR
jgi:parvulin-like peptidyl-prolyl isomerase